MFINVYILLTIFYHTFYFKFRNLNRNKLDRSILKYVYFETYPVFSREQMRQIVSIERTKGIELISFV